jgi:hypothetical protein
VARLAGIFGTARLEGDRWDEPMVELDDRDEVPVYARSRHNS